MQLLERPDFAFVADSRRVAQSKDAVESKIADAVRSELASAGVGGDVHAVQRLPEPEPEPEPHHLEQQESERAAHVPKTEVVMHVDSASSEDMQAEAASIKEQVAKDLGVDETTVTVQVTDDGRVTVSAPRVEGETKNESESKVAEAVRAELASSGVGGDVQEEVFRDAKIGLKGISADALDDEAKQKLIAALANEAGIDASHIQIVDVAAVGEGDRTAVTVRVLESDGDKRTKIKSVVSAITGIEAASADGTLSTALSAAGMGDVSAVDMDTIQRPTPEPEPEPEPALDAAMSSVDTEESVNGAINRAVTNKIKERQRFQDLAAKIQAMEEQVGAGVSQDTLAHIRSLQQQVSLAMAIVEDLKHSGGAPAAGAARPAAQIPQTAQPAASALQTEVVLQVDPASSADLQAETQTIKEKVAKDLGVDESTVDVKVTDDGRVIVSAPATEGEAKDALESKIATTVRSQLASSGGDVQKVAEVVLQVVTQGYNTWKNADNQLGILCQKI